MLSVSENTTLKSQFWKLLSYGEVILVTGGVESQV